MKGRKPVPVEVRKQNGNPSGRPLPDVIVAGGKVEKVEAPSHLTTGQLEVWDEVVPSLSAIGLLDEVDGMMLEALCITVDRAREAGRIIEQEGMFTPTARGGLTLHPAVRVERDSWEVARKIGEQFALTPVARTRLGLALYKGKSLQAELEDRLSDVSR